jgi:DNA invertase Pin-like site-specific DNA recombinase
MNNKANIYGYIRVSTTLQNDDRQWLAMDEFGVARERVFVDKQSGKDFNRPAYQDLLGRLSSGDTLVVKSLDRLGRKYDEMLEQWRIITKEKGAAIVVLDLPLLDTRERRAGDLTGILISDIVLQLFSYVAQTERDMNHQRTMEGIAAAKARGVQFGSKPMEKPSGFEAVREAWESGDISEREAAERLGVSRPTFHKWTH